MVQIILDVCNRRSEKSVGKQVLRKREDRHEPS